MLCTYKSEKVVEVGVRVNKQDLVYYVRYG